MDDAAWTGTDAWERSHKSRGPKRHDVCVVVGDVRWYDSLMLEVRTPCVLCPIPPPPRSSLQAQSSCAPGLPYCRASIEPAETGQSVSESRPSS